MRTLDFIETVLPSLRERHPLIRADIVDSMFGNEDFVTLKLLETIDPQRRGQGAGTAFMTDLIAVCDRHEIGLELEVKETDPAMQARLERFYERFGLVGEDGIMLRWPEPVPDIAPSA